jgi:thiosulfate/3-mercaptopyruvate sulfurtransferase
MSYAHPDFLVDTDWVAAHALDPDLRVIESDEDPLLYAIGDIPGALQVDWFSTLQCPLRRDLLSRETFEEVASKLGINPHTSVVFYGDKSNWFAC